MFCSRCGSRVDGSQRFCSACGVVLPAGLEKPSTEAPPEIPFVPTHRVISSSLTPIFIFVYPGVWLAAGIALAIAFWRSSPQERDVPSALIILGVWLSLEITLLWQSTVLKKVTIDGTDLIISNYFREICVPLRSIISVSQPKWTRTQAVRIYFDPPTVFGQCIRFVPAGYELPWKENRIVAELRWLSRAG